MTARKLKKEKTCIKVIRFELTLLLNNVVTFFDSEKSQIFHEKANLGTKKFWSMKITLNVKSAVDLSSIFGFVLRRIS